jgi:mono/diheme cytochrome c family protein
MRTPWILAPLLIAGAAAADQERFDVSHPKYQAECAGCHIAYPPQLLSAPAWKKIMAGLDQHFGTDASLDPALAAEIERFLTSNASPRREAATPAEPRITQTRWFRHEHDEVPAATWKHTDVKSAANCGACHTRADQGDFSERSLRLPR